MSTGTYMLLGGVVFWGAMVLFAKRRRFGLARLLNPIGASLLAAGLVLLVGHAP